MNPLSMMTLVGVLCFGAGWFTNGWRMETKVHKVEGQALKGVAKAVSDRIVENTADEVKHKDINVKIEGKKNEELAPVTERITAAPRLRVGAAICPPSPRASEAQSTGSSNGSDTSSGLVRQDVDGDIRALKLKVEEALATGRACQSFVRENGLVP